MSNEGNKKLFDHYNKVISGEFSTGNSVRNELIVSDAKRHLADLIDKNPELAVTEEPKAEAPVKSKGKK